MRKYFKILRFFAYNDILILIFVLKYLISLIKNFKINIDIRDYIELEDYITLEEWLKDNANDVLIYKDKTFLYRNIGA